MRCLPSHLSRYADETKQMKYEIDIYCTRAEVNSSEMMAFTGMESKIFYLSVN